MHSNIFDFYDSRCEELRILSKIQVFLVCWSLEITSPLSDVITNDQPEFLCAPFLYTHFSIRSPMGKDTLFNVDCLRCITNGFTILCSSLGWVLYKILVLYTLIYINIILVICYVLIYLCANCIKFQQMTCQSAREWGVCVANVRIHKQRYFYRYFLFLNIFKYNLPVYNSYWSEKIP